ncbi:MAG: hypothetical protein ABTA23_15165 [Solibacillus sp.]
MSQIIPKKDRDLQIAEVKDHLLQTIEDNQLTETDVISKFLSPDKLSTQILKEYNELYGPFVITSPKTSALGHDLSI